MRLPHGFKDPRLYAQCLSECIQIMCLKFAAFHPLDLLLPTGTMFWDEMPVEWLEWIDGVNSSHVLDALAALALGIEPTDGIPITLLEWISCIERLNLPRDVESEDPVLLNTSSAMNRKKQHEVQRMAAVVLRVAQEEQIELVVDVGAGSGYLTYEIAKHMPVIAVDCDASMTRRCEKRTNLLSTVECVTESFDAECLQRILCNRSERVMLIGLHACGNLASDTIPSCFLGNDNIVSFICVGCCYHLSTDFPKSSIFKESGLLLDKGTRKLACQSFCSFTRERLKGTWRAQAYRSMFELFASTKLSSAVYDRNSRLSLGKMSSDLYNRPWRDYAVAACEKLGIGKSDSNLLVSGFLNSSTEFDVESIQRRIALISTIRSFVSPLIESAILMDRFMWLSEYEMSVTCSNLFDYQLSQRNVVFVGKKLG